MTPAGVQDRHVAAHLDHLRLANLRPNTIRRRGEALTRLAAWAFETGLVWPGQRFTANALAESPRASILHLTEVDLARWQRERSRTVKAQTLRTETSQIREFYRWAVTEGLIPVAPIGRLVTPARWRGLPHPISEADLERALDQADAAMAVVLGLAAFAGLRACEIAGLDWADVHLTDGWLRVVEGKGGHSRDVHVSSALSSMLDALPHRTGAVVRTLRPWRRNDDRSYRISQRANDYLHSLGLTETLHHLRHRFATRMYAVCRDIRAVQEELGHRSPATTAIYVGADPGVARAAVEAIGFRRAG
jgi:integrase/recombinase XerC